MERQREEPIRHLPTARASKALSPEQHAELIIAERIRVLGEELHNLAERADPEGGESGHRLPLSGALTAWLTKPRSDTTRSAYRRDVAVYLTWCLQRSLNPVTARPGHLRAYAEHLARIVPDQGNASKGQARLAQATRRRYLSTVSAFYRFAADAELIDRDPTEDLDIPGRPLEVRRRILTAAERQALWTTAQTHSWPNGGDLRRLTMIAVLAIALDHGWNPQEYLTARVADLTVTEEGRRAITRRVRRIDTVQQFTDRAGDALTEMLINGRGYSSMIWDMPSVSRWYLPPVGPLIAFKHNMPPSRNSLQQHLEQLCTAAGIDPGRDKRHRTDRVTFSALRRSPATGDPDPHHDHPDPGAPE